MNLARKTFGMDGMDDILGRLSSDRIFVGAGDDTLEGRSGNDRLFGEGGFDNLHGGGGDNRLLPPSMSRACSTWPRPETAHSIARFSNVKSMEDLAEADFSAEDFLFA